MSRIDFSKKADLQQEAETYVKNARITSPPIEPKVWCQNEDEIRVYKFNLRGECDGLLRFRNNKFHLFYDPAPDRWRFNFAHEVAHYLIDDHHQIIRLGYGEHKSKTGFISNKGMELEADWFATGLLMPKFLFQPRCPDPNFKDISMIANDFRVSLTSAILRTIDFTPVRSAVFVTQRGNIKWYCASEDMIYSGVHSGKKNCPPPRNSKTFELSAKLNSCEKLYYDGGKIWASEWFQKSKYDPVLWEQVLPLPRYNMLITLLTFYED